MVDEYSRFPFVFPCPDVTAKTVVSCLMELFSLIGCPASLHSDRGAQFLSSEVTQFLQSNGVTLTHSSPYHPIGNGQCERYNGIIWKAIQLSLKSRKLTVASWESVLNFALHAVRSLLCTSTNETPHDRFFSFPRRSATGYTFPDWLRPGPVLLRKFVRHCKSDPLVERVQLINVSSPHYARVRFQDGRESTVSTSDLAPPGRSLDDNEMCVDGSVCPSPALPNADLLINPVSQEPVLQHQEAEPQSAAEEAIAAEPSSREGLRRSTRVRREPDRFSSSEF
jgi:transposase InsO family protein